jgi:hypothetical protein
VRAPEQPRRHKSASEGNCTRPEASGWARARGDLGEEKERQPKRPWKKTRQVAVLVMVLQRGWAYCTPGRSQVPT